MTLKLGKRRELNFLWSTSDGWAYTGNEGLEHKIYLGLFKVPGNSVSLTEIIIGQLLIIYGVRHK